MAQKLSGKIALITGGSSGIGRAMAHALAAEGVKLVLVGRSAERLQAVAKKLSAVESLVLPADLTKPADVERVASDALARFGRVDILLANAGLYIPGDVVEGNANAWDEMLAVNVNSVFRLIRAVLPQMIERKSGDIIVTSSISGHQAIQWEPVYSASKHAVQSFVHGLRRQVAPHNVRVGAVAPGTVLNELWGYRTPAEIEAKVASHEGLRSDQFVWQVPEEVPIAILFNSAPYAVMMATPADLNDFATGFALAEGIITSAAHINSILTLPSEEGLAVDLAVDEKHLNRNHMVKRSLEGRVGCGLCGIEDIKDAIRMPDGILVNTALSPKAVTRAYEALPQYQPMNAVNRTVHAAAWCSPDGVILLSREDVGRHNALDKLIGALAKSKTNLRDGFVLMSSRCSFELVQKCALAGIGALATISAPTALALQLAKQAGLKLAALSKGGVMIFEQE